MQRSARGVLAKREDHPLDIAPAAEVDDVAKIAAAASALPRLRHGVVAETCKKIRGLGKCAVAGNVNIVTQSNPPVGLETSP